MMTFVLHISNFEFGYYLAQLNLNFQEGRKACVLFQWTFYIPLALSVPLNTCFRLHPKNDPLE